MNKILSQELHNLISRIPSTSYDEKAIKSTVAEEMDNFARLIGMNYLKIKSVVPARNFKDVAHISEDLLYDKGGVLAPYREYVFPHGDGGATTFYYQFENGVDEEIAEANVHDLMYIIFILVGRARSMNFMSRALYTDNMTGVANETGLHRYIGEVHKAGHFTEYVSYFLNIKGMQMINDQHTSRVGDEVLRAYAKKLSEIAGADACTGRLGGDNFLVFGKASEHDRFLKEVSKFKVLVPGRGGKLMDFNMESRVGFARMREDTEVSEALTEAAIAKNFTGKNGNPDILEFSEKLIALMRQKQQLQANIPQALRKREFIVFYQPKAEYSRDGGYRLVGAEALIRWEKDGQMIMPGMFIPALEEMGLIEDIDFYVFDNVCMNIKNWIKDGLKPVRISSNFSQRHLQDEHFADKILSTVKKYDISPEFIEIEITESYDIHNLQKMTMFAQRMHENGIRLSVDDFGSGYASFSMIKNISADTIKLDKSLIDGLAGGSTQDEIIVRNIIHMVEELGKDMIAEGVEYETQAKFLRDCGCRMIQGFIYGRPMPEQAFIDQYLSTLL